MVGPEAVDACDRLPLSSNRWTANRAEPGWEDVADHALDWARRNAR